MTKPAKAFPKDFFWGASTSSYQVEGGNHTQWTVWELSHAAELAKSAKQRYGHLDSWPEIKAQVQQPDNYVSGQAVDHYHRYTEDFAILKQLHLNAFRFGIEWARLEPSEGQWDESEWQHYRDYLRQLKADHIEPFVNLWHWTLPVWFAEKGGFSHRRNLKYFKRFVRKFADELGADAAYVLTINEPNVYAANGFVEGRWPPQERNFWHGLKNFQNLARAHRLAYRVIKRQHPHVQVGVATQLGNIQAKRSHNLIDETTTKFMRYAWNWWFLNRIRRYQDFVGFNYYFTDYYKRFRKENPTLPLNDMGWYMEPEGLHSLLLQVAARYKKPIFITESGVADSHDQYRQWWLDESILAIERATTEGVVVKGYFHWSLLDNFEWSDGWWPKFGLVAVDRSTLKRTPRPSALWYAKRIDELKK